MSNQGKTLNKALNNAGAYLAFGAFVASLVKAKQAVETIVLNEQSEGNTKITVSLARSCMSVAVLWSKILASVQGIQAPDFAKCEYSALRNIALRLYREKRMPEFLSCLNEMESTGYSVLREKYFPKDSRDAKSICEKVKAVLFDSKGALKANAEDLQDVFSLVNEAIERLEAAQQTESKGDENPNAAPVEAEGVPVEAVA